MRRRLGIIAFVALLVAAPPGALQGQSAPNPMDVVRAFCQADGRGDRLHPRRWLPIAQLVTWTLEPAWDRVSLISGYQLHPPRAAADHIEVDVEYTVAADVSGVETNDTPRLETVTFAVVGDDTAGWRIDAPPSHPYLFANQFDAAAVRKSLDPESEDYLSASAFVWHMLNRAGWPVPYRPVHKLRDPEMFAAVEEPKPGDLALFLADDVPYHVGIVTGDNEIASATANAGLMRSSPDLFAGTILHLRLRAPLTSRPTAAPESVGEASEKDVGAKSVMTPSPRPTPRPTARATKKPRPPAAKKPTPRKQRKSRRAAKAPARKPSARSATPRPHAR